MPLVLRPPTDDRIPLPTRLASLGQSRRWVSVAAAGLSLVAAVIGCGLVVCGLDAWLHLPPLVRAVGLVTTLVAGGCAGLRVVTALRLPADPMSVALELENRFPRLNDALASSVAFLADRSESDDRGVSRRLRGAAVRRAERLAERLDFSELVPTGRCWRAFWLAMTAFAVAIPLAVWDRPRTATALTRFGDPFGQHSWPAKTRIEILSPKQFPTRVPIGDGFDLQFAVRGEIPDRAMLSVRVDADEFEESLPLTPVDPKTPATLPPGVAAHGPVAIVTTRLDPSRVPWTFDFRIRANDADTGWLAVTVVPPPRLVPLDGRPSPQLHLTPPEYIGHPPVDLPDGTAVVEAPMGSVLSLRAAADVRLSAATLIYQGDRTAIEQAAGLTSVGLLNPVTATASELLASAIGTDIPLSVDADGRTISGTFTPSLSGMYALKLTDETGLTGTRLLELRLTPDPAPKVILVRPAVDRDPPVVVPDAVITVQVWAEDHMYALRRTFLQYRVNYDGPLREITLADARDVPRILPAVGGGLAAVVGPRPLRYDATFALPVAAFIRDDGTPVQDGDLVVLQAVADDWDDVSVLKSPGHSAEVVIRIASRDAVDAWIQKELAGLRPDLIRVREQQRDAVRKAAEVQPLPDGKLTPADLENLLTAEHAQQQVRGKVTDPRTGLRARADLLRETARVNNLPRSNTTARVEAVADELGRMPDRLAGIEANLGDARQQSGQPPGPARERAIRDPLARANRDQKAVEDGLTTLLDLLAEWGGAGELRGDARLLRDAANRQAAAAEKLSEKIPPGKTPNALPADQRAELDKAGGQADQLADQASQLLGRAARLAAEKDKQAAEARAAADAQKKEADALAGKAAGLPPGTPARTEAGARAEALKTEAADLRATAEKAKAEADALRRATEAAGGQALPDDLREAAKASRGNRQGEAATRDRSAAARLDRLAESLVEQPTEDVPELAKKRKKAADQIDALAGLQEDLQKRTADAGRTRDPAARAEELKRLAPEQQKLVDQTRELVQRLTRDRAEDAAKDARTALGRMESARDSLEQGMNPDAAQKDATAKLDDARDKLDADAAKPERQLADEARRKLTAQVTALLDRHKAATTEGKRIQENVLKDRKWSRSLLVSYNDLEDTERALAVEVRAVADRDLSDLPVFARVVKDAASGMDRAAERAMTRRKDALDADPDAAFDPDLEKANDDRVRRPMDLATRRLEQVLDALKDDPAAKGADRKPPDGPKADGPKADAPPPPPAGGGGNGELIPPLAQLKALRALQAELNERTAEFARAHPDPAKLSDEDRDDLKELEDAQLEIASLFEQMAKLFQKQQADPDEATPKPAPTEEKQ